MQLHLKTLGPLYTIECRDGTSSYVKAEHGAIDSLDMFVCSGGATGTLLATTNGFVVPALKLMHCDTMRIFTSRYALAEKCEASINLHVGSVSAFIICQARRG